MTDLSDLIDHLDLEVGSGLLTQEQLEGLLKSGVVQYNAFAVQAYTLSGALGLTLDRDASAQDAVAILLWALYVYLKGESSRASRSAVVVSNPAGRTDMKNVEWALAKRAKELHDERLMPLMKRINMPAVAGEVSANELGDTKDLSLLSFDDLLRVFS